LLPPALLLTGATQRLLLYLLLLVTPKYYLDNLSKICNSYNKR
jgi:hypothetical protein